MTQSTDLKHKILNCYVYFKLSRKPQSFYLHQLDITQKLNFSWQQKSPSLPRRHVNHYVNINNASILLSGEKKLEHDLMRLNMQKSWRLVLF